MVGLKSLESVHTVEHFPLLIKMIKIIPSFHDLEDQKWLCEQHYECNCLTGRRPEGEKGFFLNCDSKVPTHLLRKLVAWDC